MPIPAKLLRIPLWERILKIAWVSYYWHNEPVSSSLLAKAKAIPESKTEIDHSLKTLESYGLMRPAKKGLWRESITESERKRRGPGKYYIPSVYDPFIISKLNLPFPGPFDHAERASI